MIAMICRNQATATTLLKLEVICGESSGLQIQRSYRKAPRLQTPLAWYGPRTDLRHGDLMIETGVVSRPACGLLMSRNGELEAGVSCAASFHEQGCKATGGSRQDNATFGAHFSTEQPVQVCLACAARSIDEEHACLQEQSATCQRDALQDRLAQLFPITRRQDIRCESVARVSEKLLKNWNNNCP